MKLSTAWSLCPFIVMFGSWYGYPGAGWYITSVFLVLIVKPKLSQAVENPSISSCISCSLLAFSAQSSAKTRSLITVSLTLLTAWRRRGLNSFPSHLYLIGMPGEVSLKASIRIAENNRLNSVGARTQPCFTPFFTGNGSEAFPSSSTRAMIPSWNCLTIFTSLSGQPNLDMIFHNPSLLTVSNAFVRSTNVMYRSWCCSMLFSCSWRAAKTISMVPRPAWNPHWLSGRGPCSRCFRRRFRSTRAKIMLAIARRDIPLWLSYDRLLPFLLYMWTTVVSLNSWGRVSLSQKDLKSSVHFVRRTGPPDLNTSAGMASGPGAFPHEICLIAMATSSSGGGEYRALG